MQSISVFFSDAPAALHPGARFLVACSGGPDSVALARLLNGVGSERRYGFVLAHVNHGLRGRESDRDERFVRALAKELGWKFVSRRLRLNKKGAGNLEEQAREGRYAALTAQARTARCSAILTAHTRDDQAETILLNLVRGASLRGLGGMRPWQKPEGWTVWLGRPLLDASKRELLDYLKILRQPYCRDRTNASPRFFRNWIRKAVVPPLEARSPGFMERLARLGRILRDEEDDWEVRIQALERKLCPPYNKGRLLDLRGLLSYSPAVQRRLLRRILGGNLLTYDGVEGLRRWMMARPTTGRLWQLRKDWVAVRLSKSKGSPTATMFWLGRTSHIKRIIQ